MEGKKLNTNKRAWLNEIPIPFDAIEVEGILTTRWSKESIVSKVSFNLSKSPIANDPPNVTLGHPFRPRPSQQRTPWMQPNAGFFLLRKSRFLRDEESIGQRVGYSMVRMDHDTDRHMAKRNPSRYQAKWSFQCSATVHELSLDPRGRQGWYDARTGGGGQLRVVQPLSKRVGHSTAAVPLGK